MSIHSFPRCASYLKAMRVKLNDPQMTDYWFAVIMADGFKDKELVEAGTVDFKTMDGTALLGAFEGLLQIKRQKAGIGREAMNTLKGYLGARGIKVSLLSTDADYWQAAMFLWPDRIKEGESLSKLLHQIGSMTKKERQTAANRNSIPEKWRAAA